MQPPLPQNEFAIPDGLPSWLAAFVHAAERENQTLADNGALQAVSARVALIHRLIEAARRHLDGEVNVEEAAAVLHRHPETIRRAVRSGVRPTDGPTPGGTTVFGGGTWRSLPTPEP